MANIKVEIISRHSIKPSSPTPPHLKRFQLSLLDQVAAKPHMPMIFFYQNDQSISYMELSILLKESLSEALPPFYPLAGRLEETSILCNDEGVEYYEASVSSEISKVIERPNLEDLRRLMPFEPAHADGRVMVGVQVNHFSCGGMAICLCISHSIVDATLYLAFVKAWATTMSRKVEAKKNDLDLLDHHLLVPPVQPALSGSFYFPPRDIGSLPPRRMIFFTEKIVAKRLIFDTEVLDELKKQGSIDVGTKVVAPTRVEVVIAFIWQRIMRAARRGHKSVLLVNSFICIMVSLRKGMVPPIPEHALGNFVWGGLADCAIWGDLACSHLIAKVRKAAMELDSKFIKKIQSGHEFLSHVNNEPVLLTGSMFERCAFTSLCRLPLYEVNFGWGKPVWVCLHATPFTNVVTLSRH